MSWQFSNVADAYAVLDPGDVPQNGAPISIWMLLRPAANDQGPIAGLESGVGRVGFVTFSNALFIANGGSSAFTVPQNEWVVLGYDDNNAISATPRLHMCTGLAGTPTWSHADGPVGGDRNGVVDQWRLGTSFDLRTHGHLAAGAVTDSRLGDAGFESLSLTDMADWVSKAVCAWQFNVAVGATALTDLTGNGADQTSLVGTPVLDNAQEPPGWSYYSPGSAPDQIRLGGAWVSVVPQFRGAGGWVTG